MLEELEKIKLKDEKKYSVLFSKLISKVSENPKKYLSEKEKTIKEKKYTVVIEPNRKSSCIITLVPENLFKLFIKLKKKYPDEFLGFTILVGNVNGRDIRVSCFGVNPFELSRTLIKRG
jgi:hypothetical protein